MEGMLSAEHVLLTAEHVLLIGIRVPQVLQVCGLEYPQPQDVLLI
jgi:hypothetical protein